MSLRNRRMYLSGFCNYLRFLIPVFDMVKCAIKNKTIFKTNQTAKSNLSNLCNQFKKLIETTSSEISNFVFKCFVQNSNKFETLISLNKKVMKLY